MEELLKSLETPRDQYRSRHNIRRIPVGTRRTATDKINYLRVEPVPLNQAVLRQNRILTGQEPALFRESFQLLRTQTLQRLKENHWNVLGVTSPCASEGKTLTAINLAITMAREVAYTVVLVDANLRCSSLPEQLGLPEQRGLSDYLTDVIPIEALLVRPYYLEDVVVLPAGQPVENSAELLNSPKMERLVSDLKSSADKCIVIFDLPPVLGTAETLAFAPQLDAALLVIEDGATKTKELAKAVDLLGATNILGTVLNKSGRVGR
jgi:capsular exopolysaccharide synthesis family protein